MRAAQEGRLGAAVASANVSVERDRARIELTGKGAESISGFVEPKRSARSMSRHFEIRFVDPTVALRVAKVLDDCFQEDPFERLRPPPTPPEEQITVRASLRYTVAVIVCLSLLTVWALLVLWSSKPPWGG
jgi:hypothetical protein